MKKNESLRLDGARVLVVEGHVDTLELNQMLLAQRGARVRAARSAEAGLDAARGWGPDAALIDLHQLEMSAFELVLALSAIGPTPVRFVGTSTDVRPGTREQALSRGFSGYLTKPIDPEDLCSAVARALCAGPDGPRGMPIKRPVPPRPSGRRSAA